MKKVLRITNPNVYAAYVNAPPLHPLVCILRYEELASVPVLEGMDRPFHLSRSAPIADGSLRDSILFGILTYGNISMASANNYDFRLEKIEDGISWESTDTQYVPYQFLDRYDKHLKSREHVSLSS